MKEQQLKLHEAISSQRQAKDASTGGASPPLRRMHNISISSCNSPKKSNSRSSPTMRLDSKITNAPSERSYLKYGPYLKQQDSHSYISMPSHSNHSQLSHHHQHHSPDSRMQRKQFSFSSILRDPTINLNSHRSSSQLSGTINKKMLAAVEFDRTPLEKNLESHHPKRKTLRAENLTGV